MTTTEPTRLRGAGCIESVWLVWALRQAEMRRPSILRRIANKFNARSSAAESKVKRERTSE